MYASLVGRAGSDTDMGRCLTSFLQHTVLVRQEFQQQVSRTVWQASRIWDQDTLRDDVAALILRLAETTSYFEAC